MKKMLRKLTLVDNWKTWNPGKLVVSKNQLSSFTDGQPDGQIKDNRGRQCKRWVVWYVSYCSPCWMLNYYWGVLYGSWRELELISMLNWIWMMDINNVGSGRWSWMCSKVLDYYKLLQFNGEWTIEILIWYLRLD